MNQNELSEILSSLKEKGALKPCPRCASNDFNIIGESEIIVKNQRHLSEGLLSFGQIKQIAMPIVIITCDNCGYVSQHAKASLVKIEKESLGLLWRIHNG